MQVAHTSYRHWAHKLIHIHVALCLGSDVLGSGGGTSLLHKCNAESEVLLLLWFV